jgi:hypothetical protein
MLGFARVGVIAALVGLGSIGTSTVSMAEPGVSLRVGPGGVGVRVGDGHRDRGRHHRGRHHSWGPGFYFYDGYYHGDCGWLRRRAEETGSRVWWRRYRQCRAG